MKQIIKDTLNGSVAILFCVLGIPAIMTLFYGPLVLSINTSDLRYLILYIPHLLLFAYWEGRDSIRNTQITTKVGIPMYQECPFCFTIDKDSDILEKYRYDSNKKCYIGDGCDQCFDIGVMEIPDNLYSYLEYLLGDRRINE